MAAASGSKPAGTMAGLDDLAVLAFLAFLAVDMGRAGYGTPTHERTGVHQHQHQADGDGDGHDAKRRQVGARRIRMPKRRTSRARGSLTQMKRRTARECMTAKRTSEHRVDAESLRFEEEYD